MIYVDAKGNKVAEGSADSAYQFESADDPRLVHLRERNKPAKAAAEPEPAEAPVPGAEAPVPEPLTTERAPTRQATKR